MPRRSRNTLTGVPLLSIRRGNNRQACFFADEDCLCCVDWLEEYARLCGCTAHAYMLMTNHVHLLPAPEASDSAGNVMKRLRQRYVQYINRSYRCSGTLREAEEMRGAGSGSAINCGLSPVYL
jgi:putative transposase